MAPVPPALAERAVWSAHLHRRVDGLLPDNGVVIVGSLTAFADRMRVDFVLQSRSIDSEPRLHQFQLRVEDDLGTPYQDLGGGFDTEHEVCAGDREIIPCPPAAARWLRLRLSPSRWASDPDVEDTTMVVELPRRAASDT